MKKVIVILLMLAIIVTGYNVFNFNIYNYIDKEYEELIAKDLNNIDPNQIDSYDINVKFDPVNKSCEIKQKIRYINKEDVSLKQIYFHLYPNAFKKNSMFIGSARRQDDGYEPGYIELKHIKVNGWELSYKITGSDDTLLLLNLPEPLLPKESLNISIDYLLKIPNIPHRFGYKNSTFNFGNWYPIAAVYDDEGWNKSEYYQIGDPFYSDVSNYNITIEAPAQYTIASSGKVISIETKDGKKIWSIKSQLMRDFAWVTSDNFKIQTYNTKDTQIKLYHLTDEKPVVKYAINVAKSTLKVFNQAFGQYPYGHISIVETNFLGGGMEYPGLVYINTDRFNSNRRSYLSEYITHELAHQWWYAVVGNDQVDEAWLDEGFATYSQVIYREETSGRDSAENLYLFLMNNYGTKNTNKKLESPVTDFNSWDEYNSVAYGKGASVLHEIKEKYGSEKLYELLDTYYNRFKFKNATTTDFFNIYQEVLGIEY